MNPYLVMSYKFTDFKLSQNMLNISQVIPDFQETLYGCCTDGQTPAAGPNSEGCPIVFGCDVTAFGCCDDGVTPANGFDREGCQEKEQPTSCDQTPYGCCFDGSKPAKGAENSP